ncbi:GAF domain-containing protein [bacterium]|nr:GAF domain-containing protein [bacterium]
MIQPLPANLVQAILAIHLAMEMEELYAALTKHMVKLCGINQFSCFLFNNDSKHYSLDYSNIIEKSKWDEIFFSEEQAPFNALFDGEPLLFPTPLTWFGNSFNMHWAKKLTYENETAAVIVFHEYPENLEENVLSLRFLLNHFTSAIVRTTIFSEMRNSKEEQASRLDLINEMGEMVGNKSLEPMLATLMGMALKLTQAEVGSILLYDDNQELKTKIEWGLNDEALKSLHFVDPKQTSYVEKICSGKEVFIETDINHSDQLSSTDTDHKINSIASFPLYTPYKNYGLLNVVNLAPEINIDEQEIETLNTISKLAATTIENYHLRKKIEKS